MTQAHALPCDRYHKIPFPTYVPTSIEGVPQLLYKSQCTNYIPYYLPYKQQTQQPTTTEAETTMKLPLAVILGATVTTSAAAFAITRGTAAASRSGSLLSNVRNNYMGNCQRKMGSSSTSLNASPVEYAKAEIASNDVRSHHLIESLYI